LKCIFNPTHDYRSINFFSNHYLLNKINSSDFSIVHLHWIGADFISISDICRINKPIVWTLHDLWPLNGFDHIILNKYDEHNSFWVRYSRVLNNWYKKYKISSFDKKGIYFVAPTQFVKLICDSNFNSSRSVSCTVINNFIKYDNFSSLDKHESRIKLKLPLDKIVVVIGGFNFFKSSNKGSEYFIELLSLIDTSKYLFVFFGDDNVDKRIDAMCSAISFGRVNDMELLNLIYSAANFSFVPSKFETFSLVALESMFCGTPVLAFNNSGIASIVRHKIDGYLAHFDDILSLKNGFDWLSDFTYIIDSIYLDKFKSNKILSEYFNLYNEINRDI
jgi:glycosyltransferase involved in cell wall biosynthesis